ncbi:MAG: hypothetical protein ACI89D_000713 [Bermanella sp.]|jgi:uncharacterized protein YndB with AHSA1/START domain
MHRAVNLEIIKLPLTIEFEHLIDAPSALVWKVLSDQQAYPEWNPFVVKSESTFKVGDPIVMRVKVLPFFAQPQTEFIMEHEPEALLSYGIKGDPLGALKSFRSHRLSALPEGGSRYQSFFQLSGWLAPVVGVLLGRNLRRGFREMSQALADRAEALARSA